MQKPQGDTPSLPSRRTNALCLLLRDASCGGQVKTRILLKCRHDDVLRPPIQYRQDRARAIPRRKAPQGFVRSTCIRRRHILCASATTSAPRSIATTPKKSLYYNFASCPSNVPPSAAHETEHGPLFRALRRQSPTRCARSLAPRSSAPPYPVTASPLRLLDALSIVNNHQRAVFDRDLRCRSK